LRTLEDIRPRPGLSVPVVTIVDESGELVEADQRALVRHVVQDGRGADVVFSAGTTGEWDRLANPVRQHVIQVCAEEVSKLNASLSAEGERGVEAWAGITTPSRHETLENLAFAVACGSHAAVLAPLSIKDVDDPVRFVRRDVADLLDASPRRIPVYLYDNADIAIDPAVPHIRTRQVKEMSRLDFVRGIKVSAPRKVLGNYTKAARNFRDRGEFGIYVGNAMLIFEIFRPRDGMLGRVMERWIRYRLRDELPVGVVAGPGNVLPREWACAWQACRAGDVERMDVLFSVLEQFRQGTRQASGRRTIACLKRALVTLGVTRSDAVVPGTPALTRPDAERFDAVFEAVRATARERLHPAWVTPATADEHAPPGR